MGFWGGGWSHKLPFSSSHSNNLLQSPQKKLRERTELVGPLNRNMQAVYLCMDSSGRGELSGTRDGFTGERAGGCLRQQNALATVMGRSVSCEGPHGLVSPFSHLAWGSRLPAGTPGWHIAEELLNVFALLMKWVGDWRKPIVFTILCASPGS